MLLALFVLMWNSPAHADGLSFSFGYGYENGHVVVEYYNYRSYNHHRHTKYYHERRYQHRTYRGRGPYYANPYEAEHRRHRRHREADRRYYRYPSNRHHR